MLKRLKNLWAMSGQPMTPEEQRKQVQSFIDSTNKAIEGDGQAEFLTYGTDDEYAEHVKQDELGWRKVYSKMKDKLKGNA